MIRSLLLMCSLIGISQVYAGVPVSGRDQKMVFSREAVQDAAAKAYHTRLKQLKIKGELDTDKVLLKHVRRICSRLIAQAILLKPVAAHWPWEIHVTSDPEVDAFSMAGGKLIVGSAFIRNYHLNDQELAVLMAHEIGHVIAEHVREQVSEVALMNDSVPLRNRRVSDVINAMQSDIAVYLQLLPLSRLQEMEADDIGIELAARTGISPKAARSFYHKLTENGDTQTIFNTHGSVAQRAQFVNSMVNYAVPVYQASLHTSNKPKYVFAAFNR